MQMNSDWLFRAEPVTMWFKDRGGLYSHPLFPWFICWTGMLFDLTVRPIHTHHCWILPPTHPPSTS